MTSTDDKINWSSGLQPIKIMRHFGQTGWACSVISQSKNICFTDGEGWGSNIQHGKGREEFTNIWLELDYEVRMLSNMLIVK